MKRIFIISVVCIALQTISAQSPLEVKSFKLENGLTVWLNEDHTQPTVFGAVVVKAGAKDSPATGIAHYFEHIMFKGTDKIGTTDYESEKIYLDSIAQKYDLLAQTTDEVERKEIQKEINRISIEAAKYAIPNEFSTLISKMGGSGLNAGTGFDETVYFNSFVPQYIDQWLELNSERMLNPVFRLFQSELETVYEEKNMYDDMTMSVAFEKLLERAFKPHPYQYPIIGLTEHLKNPALSDMDKFFKEYYVAGNMGLILIGDFDSDKVIPVIKEKFGRIPAGNAPQKTTPEINPIKGKETEQLLIPIPVVKIGAIIWMGAPNSSKDNIKIDAMLKLLSNSGGTGYLDLLGADGKLLEAGIGNLNLNDAGIIFSMVIPKLLFQSYGKAEKLVINEINRIKKGDFADEDLESIKLEMKRQFQTMLETFNNKAMTMLDVFEQGKEWDEYLKEMETIDKLTKEDIVKIANTYLTDDYIYFNKKTGRYDTENVKKPDFDPIVPPNKNETSEYAEKLIYEASNKPLERPRTVDFEKDAKTVEITPYITLYTKENPVNNIFRMQLNFRKGKLADNMIDPMSQYLNDLYTDSLSYKEFKSGLQKLGGTINFRATEDAFTLTINGFEDNIEPTLKYVSHFMEHTKPDKKALKRVVSAEKVNSKTMKKEPDKIAEALFSYAIYGKNSTYLTNPTVKQIKKQGQKGLLDIFDHTTIVECDIHYSGNLPTDKVKNLVTTYFMTEKITQKADIPVELPLQQYEKPIIFVLDNPKAKQSIIYSYTYCPTPIEKDFVVASRLFDNYFGGDMYSVMFQEIREFRSFAYGAYSNYYRPGIINKNNGSYLQCYLSTQSDKTNEAMTVLDSLLNNMPHYPDKLTDAKQSLRNNINNYYPSFRNVSSQIASLKRQGYDEDINSFVLDRLDHFDMDSIIDFYNSNLKENPICYIITGNMKQVDIEALKNFGEVKMVKVKDIFR